MSFATSTTKILVLVCDTVASAPICFAGELTAIRRNVALGLHGEMFELHDELEFEASELPQLLASCQPDIVHVVGHGNSEGELMLRGAGGQASPAAPEDIAAAFEPLAGKVRCVILSTCYSELQAKALTQHVDVVIGTRAKLGADRARVFSGALYRRLADGGNVEEAVATGRVAANLARTPDYDDVVTLTRSGVRARDLHFAFRQPSKTEPVGPRAAARPRFELGSSSPLQQYLRNIYRQTELFGVLPLVADVGVGDFGFIRACRFVRLGNVTQLGLSSVAVATATQENLCLPWGATTPERPPAPRASGRVVELEFAARGSYYLESCGLCSSRLADWRALELELAILPHSTWERHWHLVVEIWQADSTSLLIADAAGARVTIATNAARSHSPLSDPDASLEVTSLSGISLASLQVRDARPLLMTARLRGLFRSRLRDPTAGMGPRVEPTLVETTLDDFIDDDREHRWDA